MKNYLIILLIIFKQQIIKTTEKDSKYSNLEHKSVQEILLDINSEDYSVARSVNESIPQILKLVEKTSELLINDGRIFYIGSGTSGRLGIVDASECLPTFGIDDKIYGIIAGGDRAIRKSQEYAEDSKTQAWEDLKPYNLSKNDIVIGISASGSTPYVVSGINECNKNGIYTGCITCNRNSSLAKLSSYPVEVIVGPEYITGSSRMKAGTAQKLVLNMISTISMIKIGKIKIKRSIPLFDH